MKIYLERQLEPLFHNSSFGYRPKRSAHQALVQCEQNCRYKSWVLEVDIKAFFDHVNHDLILKALKHHNVPAWVLLYCRRWLLAPMKMMSGELQDRQQGTPQGGVISPLLANLFLHYAFDLWMAREHPHVPFERYADDIVCHCSRMSEAARLKEAIKARMEEVGLSINEAKSNVVYIDTFPRQNVKHCFTFLGYDFKVRTMRNYKGK